jgi:TolB-like protein
LQQSVDDETVIVTGIRIEQFVGEHLQVGGAQIKRHITEGRMRKQGQGLRVHF